MSSYKAFVDGASRGNPGEASIGVSIQSQDGKEIDTIALKIGKATNNVAEYSALIEALKRANLKKIETLSVFSDSELMVKQIRGEYRVKDPTLKLKWAEAVALLKKIKNFSISHVPREKNKRADELANQALDSSS